MADTPNWSKLRAAVLALILLRKKKKKKKNRSQELLFPSHNTLKLSLSRFPNCKNGDLDQGVCCSSAEMVQKTTHGQCKPIGITVPGPDYTVDVVLDETTAFVTISAFRSKQGQYHPFWCPRTNCAGVPTMLLPCWSPPAVDHGGTPGRKRLIGNCLVQSSALFLHCPQTFGQCRKELFTQQLPHKGELPGTEQSAGVRICGS